MLEEKILETINTYNLIENGDKIVVGVSGGPDSICLVDILYRFKKSKVFNFDIIVAHVNHMIREEAGSDEAFVKKYCEERGILFASKQIDIAKEAKLKKIGTEEARKNCKI